MAQYFNRSTRVLLALAACLFGVGAAHGRDWVDFTVAGCKVEATDAPLTNFPVAVRISTARIKGFRYSDIASPDDLLFSSTESKVPYPFEVETWNPEGESVIWVRLPLMCTNTQFRMSFNLPPNRPANPESTNVWSAANYRGVWHMNEYDATTLLQPDSSGNGFAATYVSGMSDCGVGPTAAIGKAFYRNVGNGDTLSVTTPNLKSPMAMNWNSGAVLSGWGWWKGYTSINQHPFFRVETSSTGSYAWGLNTKSTRIRSKFGTADPVLIGPGLNPASGWFHWAIRVTNKRYFEFFLNGKLLRSETHAGNSSKNQFTEYTTRSEWYARGELGYLDEIRYQNGASSDEWIEAEYDSVKDPNFVVASPVHRGGKMFLYVQ